MKIVSSIKDANGSTRKVINSCCKNIRCAQDILKRAIEIISRQLSSKRFHLYFLIFYFSFFLFYMLTCYKDSTYLHVVSHRLPPKHLFCSVLTHAMSQGIFSSFTKHIEWLFKLLVKVEAKKCAVIHNEGWNFFFLSHWKLKFF